MRSGLRNSCGCWLPAQYRASMAWAIFSLLLGWLALLPALADGCFVFRWNKSIDINEPTQKAIIVHDAGREDLLLQVKYEGPLEEFGWLIPAPSLPTVEKGSMRPFYELSQLTQQQWGGLHRGNTIPAGVAGEGGEAVKLIEVKTVGAYEVAVLSARDAGSLGRWLKSHGYSLPEGKAGIIDEYIRKGWYFIAVKINLAKPASAKKAAASSGKGTKRPAQTRQAIQKQLASGELHPLLISFDTPNCIYPLRISAVSGKPSEVSLYVLSAEPLLDKFIFDKARQKLDGLRAKWEQARPERIRNREQCEQNLRVMRLCLQLSPATSRAEWQERPPRDWSLEDLRAIAKEGQPPAPPDALDDDFYASPHELVQCLRVTSEQMPQCVKDLPRLKAKGWYLTKQVWTFRPEEMHDLAFQRAIPFLVATLPGRSGREAAALLTQLDPRGGSVLAAACQSTNVRERSNASSGLQAVKDPSLARPLLTLLKDDAPEVRLNAVRAAAPNWDPRFGDSLVALLRDRHPELRQEATQCLGSHESTNRAPAYLALLRDSDPDVQVCALRVLLQIGYRAIPQAELLRLLGSSRLETVYMAVGLLKGDQSSDQSPGWTSKPPIGDPRFQAPRETNRISSAEAAPLATNRLTMARVMGLKILRQNADAKAVELTLPLLRDTNSIVRNRAFALLQTVSGQDLPQNDPAKWGQWWAANKDSFVGRKRAQ
jgi:HEAT repeat protein